MGGLPLGVVMHAVERDGKDPLIMNLDHDKSVAFQIAKSKGNGGKVTSKKKKKRVRRKRVYWNTIDPRNIAEGSIWNTVKGIFDFQKLSYDKDEFKNLFIESLDPAD